MPSRPSTTEPTAPLRTARPGTDFADLFQRATGNKPFGFQERFATELPTLVRVPTGAGKTAMALLGWLWRRQFAPDPAIRSATPRRLVYCLPMRVLVEQTRDDAVRWLQNVDRLAGRATFDDVGHGKRRLTDYTIDRRDPSRVAVSVLMGGEEPDDWDLYPERDAILIGTQDMLLSRALNRGYGMSRFRWPMPYALLNNDALWVYDEIQLMGSGLATTSQLDAFRTKFGTVGPTKSVWMSATLEKGWLKTVDFAPPAEQFELSDQDTASSDDLRNRINADKPLSRANAQMGQADKLAAEVLDAHQPASRTLVVVNTVKRAMELVAALDKVQKKRKPPGAVRLVLVHSRYRPTDRAKRIAELLEEPTGPGTIVVATQVVEAGVDVSAKVLFTELAPWASLVQRFGRCNRRGMDTEAKVFWIDWVDGLSEEADEKAKNGLALPYEGDQLQRASDLLKRHANVGPTRLIAEPLPYQHTHVIRRRDFVDLFDTTPDLAGNDVDVSRFVRDIEDSGVQVFWRTLDGERPDTGERFPRRDELCSVPLPDLRTLLEKLGKKEQTSHLRAFRRNFLVGSWEVATKDSIFPGQVLMLDTAAGGYDSDTGWTGEPGRSTTAIASDDTAETESDEGLEGDPFSVGRTWQTIGQHTDEVCATLSDILQTLDVPEPEALRIAGRWHDRGKAHAVFQDAAQAFASTDVADAVRDMIADRSVSKTAGAGRLRYRRGDIEARYFRHELASALAILQTSNDLPDHHRDLIAYLAAAHHGKVRLSIRAMPDEVRPPDGRLFARAIWDRDELPETDLGDGVFAPTVSLSLGVMSLGVSESDGPDIVEQRSWAERALALRDRSDVGPIRLALLETLLRAADQRASGAAVRRNLAPEATHG